MSLFGNDSSQLKKANDLILITVPFMIKQLL